MAVEATLSAEEREAMVRSLDQAREVAEAIAMHGRDWASTYGGEWVAIQGGEVVAHGKSPTALTTRMARLNLKAGEVAIRLIPKANAKFVL